MEGFDIEVYMQTIKQELLNTFGDELVYLGLQGSFRRGEARESSDIDVMVILEEFAVERMAEYREILNVWETLTKAVDLSVEEKR